MELLSIIGLFFKFQNSTVEMNAHRVYLTVVRRRQHSNPKLSICRLPINCRKKVITNLCVYKLNQNLVYNVVIAGSSGNF